jgi:hypothetical protein
MSSKRTSTNSKVKLKKDYEKELYEIKKETQERKEEFNKDMENFRKKIKQKPRNINFLKSNKKYRQKPLQ